MDRPPLVVDLDGTILLDDTLAVMARRMVADSPHRLGVAGIQLLRGRQRLKYYLWERHPLGPDDVRWNHPLVERLESEASAGRHIVLATGAPTPLAHRMAEAVPAIADVMATTPNVNLTAHRKAAALVHRFGWRGFEYAGNSRADLAVWSASAGAWVCTASHALVTEAAHCTEIREVFLHAA